jgi:hypothetical protein
LHPIFARGRGCADAKFPSVAARTSASSDFIRATVCGTSSSPPDYLDCADLPIEEVSADSEDVSSGTMIPVILSIILPEPTNDISWSIMQGDRIIFQSPALSEERSEIGRALFLEYSQQYTFSLSTREDHPWTEEIQYSITALHEGRTIVLLDGFGRADQRPFEVTFVDSNCIGQGGRCTFSDTCCAGRCVRGYCRQTHIR